MHDRHDTSIWGDTSPISPMQPTQTASPEAADATHTSRRNLKRLLLVATPLLVISGVVAGLLLQASPDAGARSLHRGSVRLAAACSVNTDPTVTILGTSVSATTVSGAPAALLQVRLQASCSATELVDFEVYDAANHLAFQTWRSNASLTSAAQTFKATWKIPASQPSGSYVLELGVFTPNWQRLLVWVNDGADFQIQGGQVVGSSPTTTPTVAPTATTQPTNTPAPTATAPSGGGNPPPVPAGGATAPGTAFPTDAQCAAAIPGSTWEPRPDNATANHTVPTASQIAGLTPWDGSIGLDPRADNLRKDITGNYTGTTDQILQWAACKWGIDPNIVRAQAVQESYWHESQLGDFTTNTSECPPGGAYSGGGCYQSYGILQIKWMYNKSAWPMSRNDTAFSAEYALGVMRSCYEGYVTWLPSTYHAGDIWGCLGFWYSGNWYDAGAQSYIASVKAHYNNKDWLQSGF